MKLFDKLFGKGKSKDTNRSPQSNEDLKSDLLRYNENQNKVAYGQIVNKLMRGDYLLYLPSVNDGESDNKWRTLQEGANLKLKSVFNMDGLNVLGAFSSEESLSNWIQEKSDFTVMNSKDVLEFCQTHRIDRIVIDSRQPSMFVLERSRENIKTERIQEETKVMVGTPSKPISGNLLNKLKTNFSKVDSIEEAFQYAMVRNNESILIIGFKLSVYSDNSRAACINAIQNSMENERLELPLELFFLEDENWYNAAKGIENSLIYKK